MTYSIEEAKEFVVRAGIELSKAGLVARTWGNISARISDHQFVITPSGKAYDTLTPDDIVVVNIEDGSYEGETKPSGEKGVHAVIYELRPHMNFVIHTHQNYASALSILGETIPVKEDVERLVLSDGVPCAEYGMYATKKLMDAIRVQMQENERAKAILMRYHGAVCMGRDYDEAFGVAHVLEEVCKKEFEARCGCVELEEHFTIGEKELDFAEKFSAENEESVSYLKGILYRRDKVTEICLIQTPFIAAVSALGKRQRPYLDDLAQIAGTTVECITADANTSELLKALEKRNAVFIKGVGALCTGVDESEAKAVGIVLEKACMAAYLAYKTGKIPPLNRYSAWMDRKGYVSHYSKLK